MNVPIQMGKCTPRGTCTPGWEPWSQRFPARKKVASPSLTLTVRFKAKLSAARSCTTYVYLTNFRCSSTLTASTLVQRMRKVSHWSEICFRKYYVCRCGERDRLHISQISDNIPTVPRYSIAHSRNHSQSLTVGRQQNNECFDSLFRLAL